MLCTIVILNKIVLWLLLFFNDVIPFISVCRHFDRFYTDFFFFFRTVSRVSLSRERWFKDRGNGSCSFCLDVLWLCVAAVETSEQEAPVKHSNYQHVHVQVLWSKAFHFLFS